MVDAILSAAVAENIASLYARIYKDYKEAKANIPDMFPEISEAQQTRFAQDFYKRLQFVVKDKLSPLFDEEMRNEEEERHIPLAEDDTASMGDNDTVVTQEVGK